MTYFKKARVKPLFDQWRERQKKFMQMQNTSRVDMTNHIHASIELFEEILSQSGNIEERGKVVQLLMPLNGQERLEYVKRQKNPQHALIQLTLLFEEAEKRAARIDIMQRPK